MIAEIVDAGKLLGVVLDALGATVGVAVLFSLAILGIARASDRHERKTNALFAYGTLAVVCLLGCLTAAAYGIALMTNK